MAEIWAGAGQETGLSAGRMLGAPRCPEGEVDLGKLPCSERTEIDVIRIMPSVCRRSKGEEKVSALLDDLRQVVAVDGRHMSGAAVGAIVVTRARPIVGPFGSAPGTFVVVAKPGHVRCPTKKGLWRNAYQNQRYSGSASSLPQEIEQISLVVWNTARHIPLQGFHWNYLYSNIYIVVQEKCHVLHE